MLVVPFSIQNHMLGDAKISLLVVTSQVKDSKEQV